MESDELQEMNNESKAMKEQQVKKDMKHAQENSKWEEKLNNMELRLEGTEVSRAASSAGHFALCFASLSGKTVIFISEKLRKTKYETRDVHSTHDLQKFA